MLTLPGARVPHLNGGTRDLRFWTDTSSQEQAILFWRLVAKALKGHTHQHKADSFRVDKWDVMDYELGDQKPIAEYWIAIIENKMPGAEVYKPNPLSDMLRKQSKKQHDIDAVN